MDEKGDIPERDEVMPGVMDGPKATYNLVKELCDIGEIHVYLSRGGDEHEVHVKPWRSHFYDDFGKHGLIYTLVGDDEKWIFPRQITDIEGHYED